MRYYDNVVELIGNTPLVRLRNVTDGISATVLAKVEYFNPGGSVKDRIALRMVEEAEKSGLLQAGGTIVEPTSGNTGVGLALVAQLRGYKCVFVCPDKVSEDKRNVLTAYGAEVVVCPTAVAPEDPRSYYNVSDRLAREIPGAWKPNQYSNPNNPISHYESTGPEIWEQTDGRITHFVAGVGTGGTISGIGRYLKEASGGRVRIIGADPEGSVYSGGTGRPYLVEGVGEDFWPETYDRTICDEIVEVSDKDSFDMTRRLAREEGLLVGGSCGMAVVAALEVARKAGPDDVVVVLLPDNGRGYLSKIFNDDWMARYGFMTRRPATRGDRRRRAGRQDRHDAGDGARAPDRDGPRRDRHHARVRRLPAARAQGRAAGGDRRGGRLDLGEGAARRAVHRPGPPARHRSSKHMAPPLPMIGGGQRVSEAVALMETRGRGDGAGRRQAARRADPPGPAHPPRRLTAGRAGYAARRELRRHRDHVDEGVPAEHGDRQPRPIAGPSISRCNACTVSIGWPPAETMMSSR